jgi:uncharacterized coiled-coil protein SlyX
MQIILILLLGLGIGGVVAWLWANAKSKSELATDKIQAEGHLRVAETTISELSTKQAESRSELDAKNQEMNALQQQLRAEGEQKAAAQAELRQTRASLEEFSSVRYPSSRFHNSEDIDLNCGLGNPCIFGSAQEFVKVCNWRGFQNPRGTGV